jgi:hypothetical protein
MDAAVRDGHPFAACVMTLPRGSVVARCLADTRKTLALKIGELDVDHQIQQAGR